MKSSLFCKKIFTVIKNWKSILSFNAKNIASIFLLAIDGSILQQHELHDARSHIRNNSASKDM
jgi:hypothetical protein